MQFHSEWQDVQASDEKVFLFISNLDNLGRLMPEQVINWQADADRCSFTIQGMTDLQLKVDERSPNALLRLVPEGKPPFQFSLMLELQPHEPNCKARVRLDAALNPMLAMMAKRPLQNLVNIMAQKLGQLEF